MSIAKPKAKIVKADWAWKPEEKIEYSYDIKLKKKKDYRRVKDNQSAARRQGVAALRSKGVHLTSPSTQLLVFEMFNKGFPVCNPESKRHAQVSLVNWYLTIPAKDRIPSTKERKKRAGIGNKFYDSKEWKQLRYKAFQKHGRKCLCCGAEPPTVVLHVDHIKPRSIHPELELDIDNLQILCEACNVGKSNLDDTDFR